MRNTDRSEATTLLPAVRLEQLQSAQKTIESQLHIARERATDAAANRAGIDREIASLRAPAARGDARLRQLVAEGSGASSLSDEDARTRADALSRLEALRAQAVEDESLLRAEIDRLSSERERISSEITVADVDLLASIEAHLLDEYVQAANRLAVDILQPLSAVARELDAVVAQAKHDAAKAPRGDETHRTLPRLEARANSERLTNLVLGLSKLAIPTGADGARSSLKVELSRLGALGRPGGSGAHLELLSDSDRSRVTAPDSAIVARVVASMGDAIRLVK